jgi:hypothetical protein
LSLWDFSPVKTTARSDIDVGALLSSLQNLPPQFVENDGGPLVGAAGSPIFTSFHAYQKAKMLSSFFHGPFP